MFIIQLLIALIPFGIIHCFIKKYDHSHHKKVVNLIFYIVVSMIILTIYDYLFTQLFHQKISEITQVMSPSIHFFLWIFIEKLFSTGLPEEIVKFLAIKMSKPKNKQEIINNSLYISTLFMFYENYSYAHDGLLLGLWRSILPVHILSQIIMSYFLTRELEAKEKSKKKSSIYTVLSLVFPIMIHTLYNCYIVLSGNGSSKALIIFILGIITYIFTAKYIKYGATKCEQVEDGDVKISKFKWAFILLATLFWIYAFMI